MVLHGYLTISFLYLVMGGRFGDAKHFIIIFFHTADLLTHRLAKYFACTRYIWFLFSYYHFCEANDLVIEIIPFLYFIQYLTCKLWRRSRYTSYGFMLFHIEVGMDAFHRLQPLCLQGAPE